MTAVIGKGGGLSADEWYALAAAYRAAVARSLKSAGELNEDDALAIERDWLDAAIPLGRDGVLGLNDKMDAIADASRHVEHRKAAARAKRSGLALVKDANDGE